RSQQARCGRGGAQQCARNFAKALGIIACERTNVSLPPLRSYLPSGRQNVGVDNADQIRDAATQLFATQGYEGTSLQAIAERVGVTKQTLLYHYPSKDALRRAVLE